MKIATVHYFGSKLLKRRFAKLTKDHQCEVRWRAKMEAERRYSSIDFDPHLFAILPHHFPRRFHVSFYGATR